MQKRTNIIVVLLMAALVFPTCSWAKKKQPKIDMTSLKADSVNADAKKIKKDATVGQGLFTTYFNEKTGKLYFEIPDSALQRMYLLSSRVTSTSDGQDYVAGQVNTRPFLISFSTDGRNVYMHQVQTLNTVRPGDAIESSFERNYMNPVLKGFKIAARDKKSSFIDVTMFFGGNEKCISPIQDAGPLGKLLGTDSKLKGSFQSEASGISFIKTFERNIEIESLLSYQLTGAVQKPYSVRIRRSLVALPDSPMPMRVQDNRVGYFYTDKSIFSSDADRIDDRTYIHRWRLEPKAEDLDKYFGGELVEPQKPIVFYVDSAFPEKWRQTIKEGIEVWNRAFEGAGFKHAIKALDYPKNDPQFDPDNMNYNCFRYVATATANAMGPSYVDPRTGEILAADVIWYHNIVSLLHNWRFIQTATVDKRARTLTFSDDMMCESVKYAASHEVGHTLGLMHNMGASYSFPVEKLRDPQFTQQYGTTPSIMDYARNNYVAQPGDLERGVKLTPPDLGVYDIYAIHWGYQLIKGAKTPDDEKPMLEKWIGAHAGDPMYEFGAQQMFSTVDPTDQTEDLGNDHIKASNYGISNLKILMQHFDEWQQESGERYDNIENVYREITRQYGRYIKHVTPYIGGIRFEEVRQGDGKSGKHYFTKAQQKQAMLWLLQQARTYDDWLTPNRLITKLEIDKSVNEKLRQQIVSALMNGAALFRVKEGGEADAKNNYLLDDYLNDLTTALFIAPKGGRLSDVERHLQSSAIAQIISSSGLVASSGSSSSSSSSLTASDDDHFCGYTHDFVRINMGVSALSKAQMGAIMTGRLQRVLQKYRQYRAAATGSTRDFYDYEILLIERALSVN
jgi:hypothetical protein